MRYCAVDPKTATSTTRFGEAPSTGMEYWYLPRIRCLDCPEKQYTAGPNMTVDSFLVHLKNRQHLARVEARLAASVSAAGPSS